MSRLKDGIISECHYKMTKYLVMIYEMELGSGSRVAGLGLGLGLCPGIGV